MAPHSKGPSAGISCETWCRSPTARSMRWSSAASFPAALHCPQDASCGTWPKSRPGWPHGERHRCDAPSIPTSASAVPARSESGIRREERHRRWNENRHVFLACHPRIDDVRPFLQHMPALHLVLGLVVDAARGTALLMREALFDPVAVEAELVEQRRSGPAQAMDGERLERQPFLLRLLHDEIGDAVEGGPRHRRIGVVARWQDVP